MIIVDKSGLQGAVIEQEDLPFMGDSQLLIRFENGQQVLVPREMLILRDEGQYYLPVSVQELLTNQAGKKLNASANAIDHLNLNTQENSLVVPVVEESVSVHKRSREIGIVEIRKTVHEHTETVEEPLTSEHVEIERVAVNRIVDGPISVRNEGDTTIIPLLEEVLVIEKRLLLREEVHIKKVYTVVHEAQEVQLREERVEVVRKPSTDEG